LLISVILQRHLNYRHRDSESLSFGKKMLNKTPTRT